MGNVYITSGSVGMGTTTPSSRLEIAGNGFPLSFLTFNGTGGTNDTGLRFNTNGGVRWHFFNQGSTDLLTLRRESNYGSPVIAADYTSGNVGIGTSSPSQKLTVDGTIHSTSGGIKFPDGTIQTTAAAPSWHQTLPASERFVLVMNNLEAVLDKETGLVWEKSPSTFTFNWHGAISYCIGRVIGGRSGWHLPTIEQLRTIADSSQSSPALPSGHPFVNVQSSDYWSSTTLAGTSTVARNVTFSTGEAVTGTKISEYFHAWCVRGGQSHDGY